MWVWSRKTQESVVGGGSGGFERMLKVAVLESDGNKVRLGFEADKSAPVHRAEVWEQLRASGRPDGPTTGPAAPGA